MGKEVEGSGTCHCGIRRRSIGVLCARMSPFDDRRSRFEALGGDHAGLAVSLVKVRDELVCIGLAMLELVIGVRFNQGVGGHQKTPTGQVFRRSSLSVNYGSKSFRYFI